MNPIRRLLQVSTTIFLLLSVTPGTRAQQGADYAVQANIIYHFTKYINWPDDKKSGDFIIGVVSDAPFYSELKGFMANKTVGGQKIVVREYPASATSFNCRIFPATACACWDRS